MARVPLVYRVQADLVKLNVRAKWDLGLMRYVMNLNSAQDHLPIKLSAKKTDIEMV